MASSLNTYKIGHLEKDRVLLGWVVFWMLLGGISVRYIIRLGTRPVLKEDMGKSTGIPMVN